MTLTKVARHFIICKLIGIVLNYRPFQVIKTTKIGLLIKFQTEMLFMTLDRETINLQRRISVNTLNGLKCQNMWNDFIIHFKESEYTSLLPPAIWARESLKISVRICEIKIDFNLKKIT